MTRLSTFTIKLHDQDLWSPRGRGISSSMAAASILKHPNISGAYLLCLVRWLGACCWSWILPCAIKCAPSTCLLSLTMRLNSNFLALVASSGVLTMLLNSAFLALDKSGVVVSTRSVDPYAFVDASDTDNSNPSSTTATERASDVNSNCEFTHVHANEFHLTSTN